MSVRTLYAESLSRHLVQVKRRVIRNGDVLICQEAPKRRRNKAQANGPSALTRPWCQVGAPHSREAGHREQPLVKPTEKGSLEIIPARRAIVTAGRGATLITTQNTLVTIPSLARHPS